MSDNQDKTTNKTGAVGKGGIPAVPFSAENQPDAQKKKEGRARKKEAQALMDKILSIQDLTFEELQGILNNKDPEAQKKLGKMTVKDVICLKYVQEVMKGKLIVDFMNRHIAYAPQDVNLGVQEGIKNIKISVTKINNNDNK